MNYRDLETSDVPEPLNSSMPEWANRLSSAQLLSFIAELQVASRFADREMYEVVLDTWEAIARKN